MKPDGKAEGLRQANAWIHTWTGLPLGWLLYAVFLTGTISFFMDEVNVWMKPELHRSVPGSDQAAMAQAGVDTLQRLAPGATTWTLVLPVDRQVAMEASWREPGAAPGRAGTKRADLDAGTGAPIEARETRGGQFLYRFHFELYGIPRIWGRWIVGIATGLMLVAIISGVITHRKIFSDFFTFRPRKGQRSWLDAHNATAVLALPFHFMITFSGLLLLMALLLPWGIDAAYQGDVRAWANDRRAMTGAPQVPAPGAPGAPATTGAAAAPAQAAVSLTAMAPLFAEARQRWPDSAVGSISIENPGSERARIELRQETGERLTNRGVLARLVFDGVSGRLIEAPVIPAQSATNATYNVLTAPHLGRFAGPPMRWLLFFAGLAGTVMVATGLLLWTAKRLPERRKYGHTPWGHRLVEVLNVAAISGLSIATAAYFCLNRLIPVGIERRAEIEINGFFIVWALTLVHAMVRPNRAAWREQLALATILFAALPLLNPLTGGAGLITAIAHSQWPIAGFDLMMLAMAVLHGLALAWYLQAGRKAETGKAASPPRDRPPRRGGSAAAAGTGATAGELTAATPTRNAAGIAANPAAGVATASAAVAARPVEAAAATVEA